MDGAFTDVQAASVTAGATLRVFGPSVTVLDAHLLFSGDYKRSGDSLKIVGPDGKSVIIQDYFKADRPADLFAPDGTTLSGDAVATLAGPRAPAQYAQAGAPIPDAATHGQEGHVHGPDRYSRVPLRYGELLNRRTGP